MLTGIGYESQVEGQVVDAGYLHGQQLLGLEEVVEVGLGVDAVDVAAIGIDGREVVFPLLVAHVHRAFVGEEHGVAAIAGGHDAVEHIDASFDGLEDVLGGAYAHQIAGTVLGQDVVDHLDHVVHHLRGFAYGQTTDGGSTTVVETAEYIADVLGGILAQILIGTALNDGEQRLGVAVKGFSIIKTLDATLEPALGEAERLLGILVIALARRALVEGHHDVGTNHALGVHHVLRGEDVARTVDVALELATFLAQLADACERKDLETTAISQYRTIPGVELVESACLAQDLKTWAQIEVIGVAKNDLGLDLLAEFGEMDTLDTSHRAYGHEDGREDLSMSRGDHTCTGIAGTVDMLQFKRHSLSFSSFSSGMVKSRGCLTISLVRAKFHTSCTFST